MRTIEPLVTVDANEGTVYARGASNPTLYDTPPSSPSLPRERRRRLPTSGEAHAKRLAWGREWGQVSHEIAAQRRKEQG